MVNIELSTELKEKCPNLVLGCIEAKVRVVPVQRQLWDEIEKHCKEIEERVDLDQIVTLSNIKAGRDGYKRLGKDPSRYKLSSESLIRRIVKGNSIYQVNNVVDINNLLSISSCHPVGTYDLEKIGQTIRFEVGQEDTAYEGIGRGMINLYNVPVFVDDQGAFGSTTSDSMRAMITEETRKILVNIISFNGSEELDRYIGYAKELLERYAQGKEIKEWIIKA